MGIGKCIADSQAPPPHGRIPHGPPTCAPRSPQTQRPASNKWELLIATCPGVCGRAAGPRSASRLPLSRYPSSPAHWTHGLCALTQRARLASAAAEHTRSVLAELREVEVGCGALAFDILFPSLALQTAQGEVMAAKTLARKTPRWFFRVHPRDRGASAYGKSARCGTRQSFADPYTHTHTHTHTHTRTHARASALTCQCCGPSGPALSTRGAVCCRGTSRPGSARGQRDGERRSCCTRGRPVRGGRTECGASLRLPFKCRRRSAAPGAAPLHWPGAAAAAGPAIRPLSRYCPRPPHPSCLPAGSPLRLPRLFVCSPRPGRLGEVTPGNRAWNAQQITFSAPVGGGSAGGNPPGSRPLIPPLPQAWAFPLAGSAPPASARRRSRSRRLLREEQDLRGIATN